MNPKDELPAFRVFVRNQAELYNDAKTLLEAADAFYLAASAFDERVRACDQEIGEFEIGAFVEAETTRLLVAGTRIAGAAFSLDIISREHGPAVLAEALKRCQAAVRDTDRAIIAQAGVDNAPAEQGSKPGPETDGKVADP